MALTILIIGGGGREHAFAWKFATSPTVDRILCVPMNPTCDVPKMELSNFSCSLTDFPALVRYAITESVDLVVPCSDGPIIAGIEGEFSRVGIRVFAPSIKAAQLEGSKCWAKDFMLRHGIPTAAYKNCKSFEEAESYLYTMADTQRVVVKATGPAAGKGVLMAENRSAALDAAYKMLNEGIFGVSGKEIVIEEWLEGDEISLTMITDGETLQTFPVGQDAQRVWNGNRGPNTGGMGVYAPTPIISEEQLEIIRYAILEPTVRGIREEVGFICLGIMQTSSGPKVIEYNTRFGDPEAQALIPLLKDSCDLAKIMLSCLERRLSTESLQFLDQKVVSVVLASRGYPGLSETGFKISIGALPQGTIVFNASTALNDENQLITCGGRVFAVVAMADTLESAIQIAYRGADAIDFTGKHYRTDIGMR